MDRHTKGPWTADDRDQITAPASNNDGERQGGAVHLVAEAFPMPRTSGGRATTSANARLMAAAPDMLEALRALADVSDGRCTSCGCRIAPEGYCGCAPDESDPVAHDRRCAARAAIARAEGK